jgi:hypothetical protein
MHTRRTLLLPLLALLALASVLTEAYSTSGHRWAGSTVSYYVNPVNKWVSENAATSAIQAGAAGWHDQSRANVQLAYAGRTSGSSLQLNYKSEVFFRDAAPGAVAEAYYYWDGSGRLVDGDIVMYEGGYAFFAGSGCNSGVYIENVVIHEFGHVLGLLHSDSPGATMQPSMPGYCDRSQLTLESDDIAGIEALYPPTSTTPSTNTAPAVSIVSPSSALTVNAGTAITFIGSATDAQDGVISGNLRWSSNLSGSLASTDRFTTTLSTGTHTITAAITDSGGLSAYQNVQVTVLGESTTTPPGSGTSSIALSTRAYKVKGVQRVDLSWSGASSSQVDVYRDGARITTVANSGAYTDALNRKGGGTYSYTVCAAGTTTCSNTSTAAF